MNTIKTNDRFDKLTNLDISTHHRDGEMWLCKSSFMGAFAYWAVSQSPYDTPNITEPLKAFGRYVDKLFGADEVIETSYQELQELISEKVFESIPEIEKLNHAKIEIKGFIASTSRSHKTKPDYDYIDLSALARNVFSMLLREHITQS